MIWFSWPITSVIYWIIPAMTRNMLLWLIDAGINKNDSAQQLYLVNREEIRNLIRNELIDLLPVGDLFCRLLDRSCKQTKYVQFLDQCWRQQITWEGLSSFGQQEDFSALSWLLCHYRSSPDNIPIFLNNCSKFMKLKICNIRKFIVDIVKIMNNILFCF